MYTSIYIERERERERQREKEREREREPRGVRRTSRRDIYIYREDARGSLV